ncbi:restriction endonuclease subunit S [Staphylococcus aureus]|nr:restriction endonuclease subunit S [Staphylococcus aureus]
MTEQNTPELRFPGFKDEWNKKVLNEVLTVNSGKDYKHLNLGEYPVYGTGGYMLSVDSYLSDNDSIGIGRKGTINKPYLLKAPFWTVDTLFFCTPKEGFNISFLLNLFFTINWKKYDESTGVPSLSKITINKIVSSFPNKIEQNKIGNFFSKLDRQIELEEQKLSLLEEQKKGYMQQIFSQQLRFKDENGNEYPEWEEKKLGDILERGNKDKVNEIGKYRRLTISLHGKGLYEVKQERKTKDTRPFYQRFEGELIIGKQNFFNGSIAIVTREFNGFICSNAIMSYKISNHMNRKYLLEYLLQNDFLRKNEYLADGTGQKELSEKKFEELEIKLPNSINEQQKIGVFLERLDNLIEKQSNKLELLKQRKKSFLQKMFV